MNEGRLLADRRGAIMLFAVFAAVFLTAVLYYVFGIGTAIAQREAMQDAADAAAFSAAVLHARGMNVLALINMVMAALLAILVALQLVQTLTTIAITTIAVTSFLNPGVAASLPPLVNLRVQVQNAKSEIKPTIDAALDALHAAAVGVRDAVPAASVAAAIAASTDSAHGTRVIVLPARATLPTIDGSFAELCKHANDYLGDLTTFALSQIKIPHVIAEVVGSALTDLLDAGGGWFCGDGSSPPKTKTKTTVQHPVLPSRAACLDPDPDAQGYDPAEHDRACQRAEADEHDAEPDARTGRCVHSCGAGSLYDQRDALARRDCAPRSGHDSLYAFDWQERHFIRSYIRHGGAWMVRSDAASEERSASYARKATELRPCGPIPGAIAQGWNADPGSSANGAVAPVCSACASPAGEGAEGEIVDVDCKEVARFFGCREDIVREYKLDKDAGLPHEERAGDSRVPQALERGLGLGDEAFQVRALVRGPAPSTVPESVLRVATWGKAAGETVETTVTRALARNAVAQAEYFFDVQTPDEPSGDFLWSMRWKARLRRVRLPAGDDAKAAAGVFRACERVASGATPHEESPCELLRSASEEPFLH